MVPAETLADVAFAQTPAQYALAMKSAPTAAFLPVTAAVPGVVLGVAFAAANFPVLFYLL